MARPCKRCGKVIDWGNEDGKWIPLVPTGEDADMDRTFVDENGVLRAEHAAVCVGGPSVNIKRLDRKIPAGEVIQPKKDKKRKAA